jgi:hypothetical protein
MSEECLDREEELLQQVAVLPVLSGDLRARILGAALEARARRTQGARSGRSGRVVLV